MTKIATVQKELDGLKAGLTQLENTNLFKNDEEHRDVLVETQKTRIAEKQVEVNDMEAPTQ